MVDADTLKQWVEQVHALCPHVSLDAIASDLSASLSVERTVNRIFEGQLKEVNVVDLVLSPEERAPSSPLERQPLPEDVQAILDSNQHVVGSPRSLANAQAHLSHLQSLPPDPPNFIDVDDLPEDIDFPEYSGLPVPSPLDPLPPSSPSSPSGALSPWLAGKKRENARGRHSIARSPLASSSQSPHTPATQQLPGASPGTPATPLFHADGQDSPRPPLRSSGFSPIVRDSPRLPRDSPVAESPASSQNASSVDVVDLLSSDEEPDNSQKYPSSLSPGTGKDGAVGRSGEAETAEGMLDSFCLPSASFCTSSDDSDNCESRSIIFTDTPKSTRLSPAPSPAASSAVHTPRRGEEKEERHEPRRAANESQSMGVDELNLLNDVYSGGDDMVESMDMMESVDMTEMEDSEEEEPDMDREQVDISITEKETVVEVADLTGEADVQEEVEWQEAESALAEQRYDEDSQSQRRSQMVDLDEFGLLADFHLPVGSLEADGNADDEEDEQWGTNMSAHAPAFAPGCTLRQGRYSLGVSEFSLSDLSGSFSGSPPRGGSQGSIGSASSPIRGGSPFRAANISRESGSGQKSRRGSRGGSQGGKNSDGYLSEGSSIVDLVGDDPVIDFSAITVNEFLKEKRGGRPGKKRKLARGKSKDIQPHDLVRERLRKSPQGAPTDLDDVSISSSQPLPSLEAEWNLEELPMPLTESVQELPVAKVKAKGKGKAKAKSKAKKRPKAKKRGEAAWQEISILLDTRWAESRGGAKFQEVILTNAKFQFPLTVREASVPSTIQWLRTTEVEAEGEEEEEEEAGFDVKLEPYVVVKLEALEFVQMVLVEETKRLHRLQVYCSRMKKAFADSQVTILLLGLEQWKRARPPTRPEADRIQEAVLWLELDSGCFLRTVESPSEAGGFIYILSEVIAESKYGPDQYFDAFCPKSITKKPATAPQDVWVQQLAQIHQVSPAVGRGIAAVYKNMGDLMRAYDNCSTEHQKQRLLKDIAVPGRKQSVGASVSNRVYELFNADNPNMLLG